jgi:hypothetical protein
MYTDAMNIKANNKQRSPWVDAINAFDIVDKIQEFF